MIGELVVKSKSIRRKVAKRVVIGLLLSIIALSVVNLIFLTRRIKEEHVAEIQLTSNLTAADIFKWQSDMKSIAETIADSYEADDGANLNEDYILSILDSVAEDREDLYFVYFATEEGNMYMARGVQYATGVDVRERDWYKQVKEAGKTIVIDPYISATRIDVMLATVAAPVYIDGEFVGAVGIDADIDTIAKYVNSISVKEDSYAFLLDSKGNIVTHPYEKYIPTITNTVQATSVIEGIESIVENPSSGIAEGTDYTGAEEIYASSLVGNSGWTVIIAYPKRLYLKQIDRGIRICIFMAAVCILIAGADITMAIKRMLLPIEKINEAMDRIVEGDYTTIVEFTHDEDELGQLQNKMAEMARQLSDVVNEQRYVLGEIAKGNLSVEDMDEFPGELNEIAKSVNDIKDSMNDIISDIQFSALNLESYSMGVNDKTKLEDMQEIFEELTAEADALMEKTSKFKTYCKVN